MENLSTCTWTWQRTERAAAGQVMRVTQSLARSGMTVCATIHCPPPHTFALFDRLLVLQRGRVVYFGGNGPAAAAYFLGLPAKARPLPLKPKETLTPRSRRRVLGSGGAVRKPMLNVCALHSRLL